jgi:hypothetical protein
MTDPSPGEHRLSERSLERLRRLEADHARLFTLRQPLTAALLVALTKDTAELRARDPAIEAVEPIQAIHAVAEAQVRRAIAGDTAAFNAIVDRIEGKPGMRKGDVDEATDRHATEVQVTIERVVEALTNQRLGRPVDIEALPAPLVVDDTTDSGP